MSRIINGIIYITTPQKPRWHRTTSRLCCDVKQDLVSLWLIMTLATRLTLARSTRSRLL